ncbi:MAG: M48 family metalloprotease [Candidatus Aminicenantes bacterium]|nr:M48 family metalloprotease [Candidatus Aminicenantes bacterium]
MKKLCGRRVLALALGGALLAAACAVNPVTGKKELMLVSEGQEIALGEQTDKEVRSEFGVYEDADFAAYLPKTGAILVPHTHRPKLPYHFAVLDSPVINAFAAPGGYIYVTRGLLALMNSEAELAAVLGHELGHVNARHSARSMSRQILVQAGLVIGSIANETFAKVAGLAGLGAQLIFLKYSRDDERQADALGVDYARAAGYDPGEMVRFFQALQELGDLSGKNTLPGFLSTHPLTKERIGNVQGMLVAEDGNLKTAGESYVKRLEGLVYGQDPRQGYVENNAFYHPGLRFYVALPEGWNVQNTPTQVTVISADEKAALILRVEKSAASLPSYAEQKAATIEGRTLRDERTGTIHGLSSLHQLFDIVQQNQQPLRLQNSFIRKGDFIYTISALSGASDFGRYEGQFNRTVASFRELTERAYIDRAPKRMRLVAADGSRTLEAYFQAAGMDKKSWPQFAIMNSLKLDAVPSRGRLIKVVR